MDKMIDIDSRIDQDLAMDTTMGSSSDQDHTIDIMDKMMDSRIDQDLTMDIITMDTMMGNSSDQDHTMDKMKGTLAPGLIELSFGENH